MRVKVLWQQSGDTHQKEYVVTDSPVLQDNGTLCIYKTNGDNVFFNPRVWIRAEVDNSGQ